MLQTLVALNRRRYDMETACCPQSSPLRPLLHQGRTRAWADDWCRVCAPASRSLVAGARKLEILARLASGDGVELSTKRLCEVCAEATAMTGAGIMLMSGDTPRGSICTTGSVSALIEELQYDLGEGPCVDAYRQDQPVLEPDLANPVTTRWPSFAVPALTAGARAVFGFPLRVGLVRLGAMNLFSDRVTVLDDEQHANALVMADVAAETVLLLQAGAPLGEIAKELSAGADFKYVVHQAAGMVAAQLDITVTNALLRLRAHAFSTNQAVTDVARNVVARNLRFFPDSPPD